MDADDEQRLTAAVQAAHAAGLWIRYYTLDGYDPADTSSGWGASYNFGSLDAAAMRWRAAIQAGVDFVAVNQYEAFVRELRRPASARHRLDAVIETAAFSAGAGDPRWHLDGRSARHS